MTQPSETRPGILLSILAACAHLGYLPVGAAVLYAVADPARGYAALIFCLAWTVLALLAFGWQPATPFLRDHWQQARQYHRLGMMAAVSAVVATVYVAIFTWGLGGLLALCLAPPFLLAWMVPTWSAAFDALRGRPHQYSEWTLGGLAFKHKSVN